MTSAIQDGYSWINVKQFKEEDHKTIEAKYEALKLHHQKETEFLIKKVRELDKQDPTIRDLIPKIEKCKKWMDKDYKNLIFYGPDKNIILAIVDMETSYLKIDIVLWKEIAKSLKVEKIDGSNYHLIAQESQTMFKNILGVESVYCRELRKVIVNTEEHQKGVNFFIL